MYASSDLVTYVIEYNRHVANALSRESNLSVTQYRMLAYLDDHPAGGKPSQLARALGVSPASITASSKQLARNGLVNRQSSFYITKGGTNASRNADLVLIEAHDAYFLPLDPRSKEIIEAGCLLYDRDDPHGLRMRSGHFFSAFATFAAFLRIERLFTDSTTEHGLTLTEFRVLFETQQRDEPVEPKELSRVLVLGKPNLSYALKQLQRKGLVQAEPYPGDMRRQLVSLTKAGTRRYEYALPNFETVFSTMGRDAAPGEVDSYKDAATTIVSALRRTR